MSTVNIFTRYEQKENDFTNGLVAILNLSRFDNPHLVTSFLLDELGLVPNGDLDTFRVLRGIQGTADGELRGEGCCIQFETKIVSGTLDAEQIDRHLKKLRTRSELVRRLVLLTPDESRSRYIQQFRSRDTDFILHLGWKRVYDFLLRSVANRAPCVFSELVRQFLERIRDMVFEQDIAGVIVKIHFGKKSEVYEDRYLADMKAGMWTRWDTPREYRNLDGTGRKLLLYDRTKQGITAEVEIEKVERTDTEPDYPWTNQFAPGTLRFFEPPISLSCIRRLVGFESFGVHRKDRSPYRNITREQYQELSGEQPTVGLAEPADASDERGRTGPVGFGHSSIISRPRSRLILVVRRDRMS